MIIKILKAILLILLGFLALNVLFFAVLAAISLTAKKAPIEVQRSIYRRACTAFCLWACGMAGAMVHVSGKEKLPEGRFLLVCNHKSLFDPLSMVTGLRDKNISFISKPSNMNLPVIGRLAWGAGYLPIDREDDREALKTVNKAAEYLKKDLCSICIYPEGTRSKTESMLPFRAGCFKIAKKAGVPIVVCASKNTDKVFKNIFKRRTHIYIDILETISPEEVASSSTAQLSARSRRLMEEKLYG